MTSMLAMAGYAEMVAGQAVLITEACLAVVAVLLAISFWRRSWRWGISACVSCGLLGLLLQPWSLLGARPELLHIGGDKFFDPDEIYWIGQWQGVAYAWFAAAAGCLAVMILVLMLKKRSPHSFSMPTYQILSTE